MAEVWTVIGHHQVATRVSDILPIESSRARLRISWLLATQAPDDDLIEAQDTMFAFPLQAEVLGLLAAAGDPCNRFRREIISGSGVRFRGAAAGLAVRGEFLGYTTGARLSDLSRSRQASRLVNEQLLSHNSEFAPNGIEANQPWHAIPTITCDETIEPPNLASPSYTPMELMICAAASTLEDGAMVVVGTGAPCAAAMLAQKTIAPNLTLMFEAGGVGPRLPRMPISVGDSRTFHEGLMATSMSDIMETCQRGMVDYTFLGGAQIDAYGNLNSTMIGDDFDRPQVRLPGSGGASDLGSLCWRVIVITPHDRRRFVETLEFVTTPGYLDGPGAREAAGLPPGSGPYKVVTSLAVLGFHDETKRMQIESLHPGVTVEQVQAATGFRLGCRSPMENTAEPTAVQLEVLRSEVDPHRYIIGR